MGHAGARGAVPRPNGEQNPQHDKNSALPATHEMKMYLTERRQQLGQCSEQLAVRLLKSEGYTIEAQNVRFPVGELDIVAREGQALCFVEVRSTRSSEWGGPLASIGARKQSRLVRAAHWYVSRHRDLPPEIRFDVVAITWHPTRPPTIELIRGAFDASQ